MQSIIQKAVTTHNLYKSEIIQLLNSDGKELFTASDKIRQKFIGNEVHLRALIEFSNICKNNCLYCGIRKENKNIDRFCLNKKDILDLAQIAISQGYKTIVLQSGEGNINDLPEIIQTLKSSNDIAITLSLGEYSFDTYKELKEAGADRFLLRIETTDKNLYKQMHPDMNFENRLRCLRDLKSLGYEVGTGCLVGLPNQTVESLADDILFFKEIDADMIGIGPLITHPDTPLKDYVNGDFWLALKVMAITRLLLPDINIPATTAMETIYPNGRLIALQSGANVIMPNITFDDYRKKYDIYPNKASVNYENLKNDLYSIGRTISADKGFRKKEQQ